jgi:uncharacterized protein involved in outer membrane biogenesis
MRWKWVALGICGFVIILTVVICVILSSYDFNSLKPEISKVVRGFTGREITFGGDIRLEFGFPPTLAVNDVRFQNAPWGSRPQMVKINRFEVQVDLLHLILGKIEVKRLVLIDPDILIETDKTGRSNLEFGSDKAISEKPEQGGAAKWIKLPTLVVNELQVTRGRVTYREGRSAKVYAVSLDSLTASARDCESPLKTKLKGSYQNIPFKINGSLGPLAGLIGDDQKLWPLNVTAEAFNTILVVEGAIKEVRGLRGMDLGCTLKGNDLATLGGASGKPLPLKGAFIVSGRVNDPAPGTYRISGLKVVMENSRVDGTIEASFSGGRPMVKAVLTSPKLDISSILARSSSSHHIRNGRREGKVFPKSSLPFEALRYFDAEVKFQGRQVFLPKLTVNQLSAEANLKDGRLFVKPLKLLVAGGTLDAQLDLKSQGKIGVLRTSIRGVHLNLGQMLRALKGMDVLEGHVDVSVDVRGHGSSIAALMGELSGKMAMVMGQGRINNNYIDLLGADVSTIFSDLFGLSKEEQPYTLVNCFVSGFNVSGGLAEATALLLETDRISMVGEGEVDLRTERLNLRLNSIPKGGIGTNGLGKVTVSLGGMIKAFRLTGTIAHPSLSIDPQQTVLTVGKMIGGTILLGPIGLLVPFVTNGEAESPCSIAKQAAMQGVKMSVLAKQQRKGIRLLELPEEGLKELGKGLKKLFGN